MSLIIDAPQTTTRQTVMTASQTRQRVDELKAAGEDFEWYPTTDVMLGKVAGAIRGIFRHGKRFKMLDVGAGDGRVLTRVSEMLNHKDSHQSVSIEPYAIEKSLVHLAKMPKGVIVVGTDFLEQTLCDKDVDIIFSNPPYSQYEQWAARIIRESPATHVFLIIPQRWQQSKEIEKAIDSRGARVQSLGKFDFETADRKARAKVEILRITIEQRENEAFDLAIEEMLPELKMFDAEIEDDDEFVRSREAEEASQYRRVASGGSVVESLVHAYKTELGHIYDTYRAVVQIDIDLLRELGVTKTDILSGLRSKIRGLKKTYWASLFEHVKDITKRLATKQREEFLSSINNKSNIDFTAANIYSMLMWISKCASSHFDDQLVDLFKNMVSHANVENYRSNEKVFEGKRWRYLNGEASHYQLCYRLVMEHVGGINTSPYRWEAVNGLRNSAHEFLGDFVTVANNLGFDCDDDSKNHTWKPNKKNELRLNDGSLLMDVRAFKNGNLHIRVAKSVMLAINVQAGKLLGWLRTADEAADEMNVDGADADFVKNMFGAPACTISADSLLKLGFETEKE